MKIVLFVILLLISGCTLPMKPKDVMLPANITQQCLPLNKLEGMTGKDLLKNITDNAAVYHHCADMHRALIEATKPTK